eukprot:CAMPEP_0183375300 /NCGR_PEP_ID=MMETSP0164_2-20130417/116938_1 /TAXON_ID=221442 /ORGANISM="Coccolithus pelagicus ssp braarudi, Strain PLY182g" /LENGTH=154 /DNA_ID=CAMNT_0025552447 /DNA_START=199 /DNA_END=659 /DNA_ORIENTATION=+
MAIRRARALVIAAAATSEMRPIGHIQSMFPAKFGTPRQGSLAPSTRARLQLEAANLGGLSPQHALDGIAAYSHVWLVWAFHLNEHVATRPKVQPPRLRGEKRGLFATRTPFRPNPIGLSLVQLDGVDNGDTLMLSGVDLVDGTPVYDIKPYIPV